MKKLLATVLMGASMLTGISGFSANSGAATHNVASQTHMVIPTTKTEPTVPVVQTAQITQSYGALTQGASGKLVHWEYRQVPIYDNFGLFVGYRTESYWVPDAPIWVPVYPRY